MTRTRLKDGQRLGDVRFSCKTPKYLVDTMTGPCACGEWHPLLWHDQQRPGGLPRLRAYTKITPRCGPVYSIQDYAKFYEDRNPALTRGTIRSQAAVTVKRSGVERLEPGAIVCRRERLTLDQYTSMRSNKRQRPLNVARTLVARPTRLSVPKKDGITPIEWAHYLRLLRRYPTPRYRILKAGGTPDFHIQEWITISGTRFGWVTILQSECKAERDALSEVTQAAVCEGLDNAFKLSLPIPLEFEVYGVER